MYCRTIPLHPKANSKGLYPLHRVLVENKLGRYLGAKEIVHHINEDKNDNAIENLMVLSNEEHSRLHAKTVEDVVLKCPQCGSIFHEKPHFFRLRQKKKQKQECLLLSVLCGKDAIFKITKRSGVRVPPAQQHQDGKISQKVNV